MTFDLIADIVQQICSKTPSSIQEVNTFLRYYLESNNVIPPRIKINTRDLVEIAAIKSHNKKLLTPILFKVISQYDKESSVGYKEDKKYLEVRGNDNARKHIRPFIERVDALYKSNHTHFILLRYGVTVVLESKAICTYNYLRLERHRFLTGDLYLKGIYDREELIGKLPKFVIEDEYKFGVSTYLEHSYICNVTVSKAVDILKSIL